MESDEIIEGPPYNVLEHLLEDLLFLTIGWVHTPHWGIHEKLFWCC